MKPQANKKPKTSKRLFTRITVVIAVFFLVMVLGFLDVILIRPQPTSPIAITTQDCSWIKLKPTTWSCFDNWQSSPRVNRIQQDDSYIELQITAPHFSCVPILPLALYSQPSISGLTIPHLCLTRHGFVFYAHWIQDGDFQLIGKNVTRKFFLQNLSLIGDSFERGKK